MAELADAHGSGPCDSNIMRVQVPSSARRLKSKDLSLFRYYIFTTFSSIQAKFYWHSKHYRRHIHCPQKNIPKAQGIPLFSDFLCLSPPIATFRYFISAAASKKRTPHRHCSRLAQTVPPSPLAYSRAIACDNLHLRASSHHWHIRAFFVIGNFLLRLGCQKVTDL